MSGEWISLLNRSTAHSAQTHTHILHQKVKITKISSSLLFYCYFYIQFKENQHMAYDIHDTVLILSLAGLHKRLKIHSSIWDRMHTAMHYGLLVKLLYCKNKLKIRKKIPVIYGPGSNFHYERFIGSRSFIWDLNIQFWSHTKRKKNFIFLILAQNRKKLSLYDSSNWLWLTEKWYMFTDLILHPFL